VSGEEIERKLYERRLAMETLDSDVLIPCPWCGSAAVRGWYLDLGGWVVSCKDCLGRGPWKPRKKEAIIAWNNRAAPVR
jgi:Lar family restriction alleviation protein